MQVEGSARINASRASASPKSNKHSSNAIQSSKNHDTKHSEDPASALAPLVSNAGSSSEDHAKDSSPSNDSRRRAQKTSMRRRSQQAGASPQSDRRRQSSADDHASGSISPRDQECEYSATASATASTRACHRSTLSRSGGASSSGSGGSGAGRRAGWSTPDDHMEQQRHPEQASRVTTPSTSTVAPTTKRVEPSTASSAESRSTSPSRGRTRTVGTSEASPSGSGHTRASTQHAQDADQSSGRNGQTRPGICTNDSDGDSNTNDGNGAAEGRHMEPQAPRDTAEDKPARSSDQRSRQRTVTHVSTASAGSRRPPPCHHHHHHHHRHHNHNHSISHTSRTTQNSPSPSSTRAAHNHTHTRNYSSPSLLDSFTSPEPMLSPIQSYFGSDPNSPASSFSLPRHDHYSRLSVDQSLDPSGASPMDGYHGFATHIWSEQSTTPAHALSHRWTRRLSQPDAYPSLNRSVHHLAQENLRASASRSSSTALPRAFAPAAMDQPWSEGASSIDLIDREFSTASDDIYDVDHDLVSGEDVTQDSADEGTMDDSYGDYESTYDHNYDHNHNLRNWDEDDEFHDDETYPYGYQVPSVGAQADVDMNDGEDEDLDSDQHLDEIIDSSRQAPSHGGLLIQSEMDDMSEEESEMVHILGFDRQQNNTSMAMLYGHTPTATPSSPDSASSQQASSDDTNRSNASDEALARRLQEEEYARLMGERRSMSSTLLSSNSLFRPSPDSPRWPSDYRSALGLTYSTAYPDRSRHQSATRSSSNARTEEDRRRRVFRAMASSSSSGRRPSNGGSGGGGGGGGGAGGGGGGGDPGRIRGRPSGARSAFIEAHSASARLSNRTARGRRSRSPPPYQQQQQHQLLLHHQDLPSSLTRTLQNTTRILDLLDRFTQRLESGVMDRMWGNPDDYMHDDQVDDSYEGLLRLSERIGLAKPKGVAEQTLRAMDRHISSWGRMKRVKATTTLRSSTTPASSAEECLDENCTICLQTYDILDLLRTLPCRHGFHVECIDTWLQTSAQCPICRQEVTETAVASMQCL
ncbi:unnamed protein product [Mortierella alpina]